MDSAEWNDLVELGGVDVVRVDATVGGGVSSILPLLGGGSGPRMIPHVFGQLHGHLSATGDVSRIEVITPESGAEPLSILGPLDVSVDSDGRLLPSSGTGIGWDFDWDAVEHYAVRKARW